MELNKRLRQRMTHEEVAGLFLIIALVYILMDIFELITSIILCLYNEICIISEQKNGQILNESDITRKEKKPRVKREPPPSRTMHKREAKTRAEELNRVIYINNL